MCYCPMSLYSLRYLSVLCPGDDQRIDRNALFGADNDRIYIDFLQIVP